MSDKAKKIFIIVLFAALGLLADQVKVTALVGAKGQAFTLLQLFAPAMGALVGSVTGVVTVLLTEVASFVIQGKAVTLMNIIRLLPLLFATVYFASLMKPREKKSRWIELVIPALAMFIFWAHPEGRQAWYFALYWTIPMIIALTPLRKSMAAMGLGATFTAHAVGGATWIWMTGMAAPLWTALIPIVAMERAVFGAGIALTFVAVNILLASIPALRAFPIHISRKHLFGAVR